MRQGSRRALSVLLLLFLPLEASCSPPTSVSTRVLPRATDQGIGPQSLSAISCPSVRVCYATGEQGTILATHDAGHSWQRRAGGTVEPLPAIACPAVRACFLPVTGPCGVLGPKHLPILYTDDGGTTWTRRLFSACPTRELACPSATTCYAFGYPPAPGRFYRTDDGGKTWRKRGTTAALSSDAISLACPTTSVCYFGGDFEVGRSTDGTQTWRISRFSRSPSCSTGGMCVPFPALACPSRNICYAGGRDGDEALIVATRDGGRTWTRQSFPGPGIGGIAALSCPTSAVCVAMDSAGRLVTTEDGRTWQRRRVSGAYPFDAIACPGAAVCYAAGYLGRIMGTVDAGRTWRDVIPAVFVSGSYGPTQPSHTYSRWFTATHPWHMTLGVSQFVSVPGAVNCRGGATIVISVQNAAEKRVAVPMRVHPGRDDGGALEKTVNLGGRLRLDVVARRCSPFSIRVDGVKPS